MLEVFAFQCSLSSFGASRSCRQHPGQRLQRGGRHGAAPGTGSLPTLPQTLGSLADEGSDRQAAEAGVIGGQIQEPEGGAEEVSVGGDVPRLAQAPAERCAPSGRLSLCAGTSGPDLAHELISVPVLMGSPVQQAQGSSLWGNPK